MKRCGDEARHTPRDAMTLLVDPERIRFACNPFENAAWKRASQMTKGSDDLLVGEAFADRRAVQRYAERLQRVCEGELMEFVAAVAAEPLRIASIPKLDPWDADEDLCQEGDSLERGSRAPLVPTRDIAVRTVFGRCVSTHLAGVLTDCADPWLPAVAAAYRPGRSDAVQHAILDAADVVAHGHRFWVKVDVADAFNSLPRRMVGEELKALGFDDDFAARVLAVVGAPRVRRIRGRWVPVANDRGCPAGLPESAVLINVLFRRFDLEVARRHPNVTYIRYSDDLLFLARTLAEAEAVATMLLRWTGEAGLALKGVSPNQRARTLVHEIDQNALPFLGAEIGPDGDIHIPSAASNAQIRKLQFRLELAHREGHLVAGVSRYALGSSADAVPTFDGDDVQRSAFQFHWYWRRLNTAEANGFLARVGSELGLEPTSTTGPCRKVWATTLGGPDDAIGGGRADLVMIRESFTDWVRDVVIPRIEDALLDERNHPRDTSEHGTESIPSSGDGGRPIGHRDRNEASMADDSVLSTLRKKEPVTGDFNAVDDAYEPGSKVRIRGFARGPRGGASDGAEASGPTTPVGAVPPSPPVLKDLGVLFFSHRIVRGGDGDTVVIATDLRLPGCPPDTRVMRYRPQSVGDSVQAEIVVLEHMAVCLRQASSGARIAVAMESTWLVKLLIQRGREIRSTSLFQHVRALHAEHPDLVVIGPCGLPRRAARLLQCETDLVRRQEERRRGLRMSTRTP